MITGRLSLKYGKYMAVFSAALLTVKNLKPSEHPCEHLGKHLGNLKKTYEEPGKQPVKELT